MSVRFNQGVGMWVAYDDETGANLGYFSSQEEARAAEGSGQGQNADTVSSEEFADASQADSPLAAVGIPDDPGGREAVYDAQGNQTGWKEFQGPNGETLYRDPYVRDEQGNRKTLRGGPASSSNPYVVQDWYAEEYGADAGLTTRPSEYQTVPIERGPDGHPRVDAQGAADEAVARDREQRGGGGGTTEGPIAEAVGDSVARNEDERTRDVADVTRRIDDAKAAFYEADQLSQEARQDQRAGLAMNQELYDLLLDFDPEAYAQKHASEATASALSLARGAGGGAGARQFAVNQAIETAPQAQADAARLAQAEQAQRRGQALQASEQFGSLATGTRAQDQARADAVGNLGLAVADGVARVNGIDWQLDSAETEMLGNVYLALERANIDWASLDETERHARAMEILAKQGLDQEFRLFQEGRQVSGRDILGGIFQLGGGLISAGGAIGAAGAR